MVDINSIIEGTVKFRDGKKWKSRWCVMRKLSPVADCLHLQFYRDSKERYKNGQTKASLSLEHFLGIESGFTLDKESNTIAILCQDVVVIMAFDTREILMQWQVKISNNLGDDVQYLILIASAATKVKIPSGPARLHIQNYRFCITTGIPPRIAGQWDIAHLRRYGVVENRFCFEGGSSSGKCEGFVVLITDFGDDITNAFKLASQGKLSSKIRHLERKGSVLDSPRKINISLKDTQSIRDDINRANSTMSCKCDCSTTNLSYWPSQESRSQDSYIGCDSSSYVDDYESNDGNDHFSRKRVVNLERCMSCISKQSAPPGMSRSSTITDGNQSICYGSSYRGLDSASRIHMASRPSTLDRMSMRSQESVSNMSEYSIPRQCNNQPHTPQNPNNRTHSFSIPDSQRPQKSFVGSYENYDSPKIQSPMSDNQNENYDKPRSIKMYLEESKSKPAQVVNEYGNYDTPTFPKSIMCGCNGETNVQSRLVTDDIARRDCTCHRVMSWADSWISIPYCRRGNSIENTGIPVSRLVPQSQNMNMNNSVISQEPAKCKLVDYSNSDTNSLYASIDTTKKQIKRITDQQVKENVTPIVRPTTTPSANYANLDFEKSLENYENAKNVLQREKLLNTTVPVEIHPQPVEVPKPPPTEPEKPQDNYLVMEVREKTKQAFSGYISMLPASSQNIVNEEKKIATLPSLPHFKKPLLFPEEKSYSNPNLNRPSIVDVLQRIPAKVNDEPRTENKLLLFKKSSSVDSFRFMENGEMSPPVASKSIEDEPSTASINTYQELVSSDSTSQSTKSDEPIVKSCKQHIKVVHVRNTHSLPKTTNRDSSSSNDSGVSTASTVPKDLAYSEFELPLINHIKKRKHHTLQNKTCVHASLIRRSKSFDPFGDLTFQFNNVNNTSKTISSNPPTIQQKGGNHKCPSVGTIMTAVAPYVDSNSTSSGTSDMSDYIETLSLSSHSSSDVPEGMRSKQTVNTLRPRSGKEYQNIDRATLVQQIPSSLNQHNKSISSNSSTTSSNANYVNITPVPENSESPSPGYQSSTSFQDEFVVLKTS